MTSLAQRMRTEHKKAAQALDIDCNGCIGVDEVGRGCLAGPVVAAAVWIHTPSIISDNDCLFIRDSKTLSAKHRLRLYRLLKQCAYSAVAMANVTEIDQHNILQSTMLAMQRSIDKILPQISESARTVTLIDGNRAPELAIPHLCVVRGDSQCVSIAAASIVAKTVRDRLMHCHHAQYPNYDWNSNAGYGTKRHLEALQSFGVTPLHRQSFRPVRECKTTFSG